jgi:biotin-dependent carboxylase-like uncharacterized protein
MSLHVLAPGLLTTVQGSARTGSRHLGVGSAGVLDAHSHAIANLLVANAIDTPVLEITLAGPRLRFERATRIAICGAEIDARIGAEAIPGWRTVHLPAGSVLALGACRRGARAYLAVHGGFEVPRILGSMSTDLRGGFGGFKGRALRVGDIVGIAASAHEGTDAVHVARWWIDPTPDVDFAAPAIIRVVTGSDATMPRDALFAGEWIVANASDRQGLRLEGNALRSVDTRERTSEPVAPGTIQLPPDGCPIVLLADAQTHGGYPRIGHAIRADWPRLAQLRPGERLRFRACTRGEAHQARLAQAQRLARIGLAIAARARDGST